MLGDTTSWNPRLRYSSWNNININAVALASDNFRIKLELNLQPSLLSEQLHGLYAVYTTTKKGTEVGNSHKQQWNI